MDILQVKIDGFKNLKNVDISPIPGNNVIIGENAQGKTNLIEAIWLMSGARSFRGTKEKDCVAFDGDYARMFLSLRDSERTHSLEAVLSKNPRERKITLNGVKVRYLSSLFGVLKCVIFTPDDLDLSKGSPDKRRDFIDLCVSQIKPAFAQIVARYENVLNQRNALLKNVSAGLSSEDELDVWDEQMSRYGAYISMFKYQYSKKLDVYARELYEKISGGREPFELRYLSTVYSDLEGREDWQTGMSVEYLELLRQNRQTDIKLGFTTAGIHRDDLAVLINGISARDFGSQGQNRSAALCMKLAQAYILNGETNEMPVVLLDDVLSELDSRRREFVIQNTLGMQVFITCCEQIKRMSGVRYIMSDGKISVWNERKNP